MKQYEVLFGEPTFEPSPDESGFGKIRFEIADGESRQACSITVSQPDAELALALFHSNWPVIGKMARDVLTAGELENGEVRLVAPS